MGMSKKLLLFAKLHNTHTIYRVNGKLFATSPYPWFHGQGDSKIGKHNCKKYDIITPNVILISEYDPERYPIKIRICINANQRFKSHDLNRIYFILYYDKIKSCSIAFNYDQIYNIHMPKEAHIRLCEEIDNFRCGLSIVKW